MGSTHCHAMASSCVSNDFGCAATKADMPGRASRAVPVYNNHAFFDSVRKSKLSCAKSRFDFCERCVAHLRRRR